MRSHPIAIVRGAGDLGTGVAYRLWRAGFRVLCIDLEQPLVIRRSVAFASALYDARITVEGAQAERIMYVDEAIFTWQHDSIPVVADPVGRALDILHPDVVVDAIMAKRNLMTHITDAAVVIALGPGFTAGVDCHAVIETQRGHDLGRVIYAGSAAANTGMPGTVGGADEQRVVRAPRDGTLYGRKAIGDMVQPGDILAQVESELVRAQIGGVLRGLIHDGLRVSAGMKIGDVDPRAELRYCYSISDKALAVGGGVVEAALMMRERWESQSSQAHNV